ncbi:LOW QUALITY PROTEIN: transmembrane protein 44 [Chelonoidis abingdonii]|uniref:LOW QUALITY PROTEIN: transmembrane protein 44 n=1 Tax=Chelonoidis abingdonii TaxID=106734 RepID=UPI003F4923BE
MDLKKKEPTEQHGGRAITGFVQLSVAPLVHACCRRKGWQEVSVLCIIYSFVGSMCNTIGALLAKQLAIQVFTGAYMAAVDIIHFLLTLFPVCASDPRPTPVPTLSSRLALAPRGRFPDRLSLCLVAETLSCAASPGRRKRRRRQVRSSLLALALPLCTGPGWYVLVMATSSSPEEFHGAQRRLLGTALQENMEVLGFALGMLAALVAFTARIPALSGACRGRLSPVTQHWASISSALASVLYAAAIVTHDQRPAYFMRAMPWLLLSLGSAALDVAITCLSCLMKSQMSQRLGLVAEATETPATWELLTQAEEEEEEEERTGTEEGKVSPPASKFSLALHWVLPLALQGETAGGRVPPPGAFAKAPNWLPLNMFSEPKSLHEGAAVGRCLDLTIEQVQQASPPRVSGPPAVPLDSTLVNPAPCYVQAGRGAVRLPGDGQMSAADPTLPEPPAYPPVQVIHAKLSPSSSSYVSSISSELEWDFGDMNLQWNRNSTEAPNLQPGSSSVLNTGFGST